MLTSEPPEGIGTPRHFATLVLGRTKVAGHVVDGTFAPSDRLRQRYESLQTPARVQQQERAKAERDAARYAYLQSLRLELTSRDSQRIGLMVIAVDPSGRSYPGRDQSDAVARAADAWQRGNPQSRILPTSFEEWRETLGFESQGSVWRCEFVRTGAPPRSFDIEPEWSWWRLPLPSVLGVLEGLEAEGWRVVQISEDKGLYQGMGTGRESGPVTVRYLMARPRTAA